MGSLGILNFDVRLKDLTDSDIENIRKKLEKLNAKVGVSVDAEKIAEDIQAALSKKKFKIDVEAKVATKGVSGGAAASPKPLKETERALVAQREAVAAAATAKANAYASAQAALAKQREASAAAKTASYQSRIAALQKNSNFFTGNSVRDYQRLVKLSRDIAGTYSAGSLLRNVIEIGGQFEVQQKALENMLGSMEKGQDVFAKVKSLALESPFTFSELGSYTKQLTAYGIPYKELADTTKRLADISAGVGVDMSRIILAYGQVRSAGVLRGQELRQFTEAGIPLVEALADRFTKLKGEAVSAGDVFKMISERAVSFEDVKAILTELTDEGGRFYNMQAVLTNTVYGQWQKLKDNIEMLYGEIAKSQGGFIKSILNGLNLLVSNSSLVVSGIQGLVAGYGLLKAAELMGVAGSSKTVAASIAREAAFDKERYGVNSLSAAYAALTTRQVAAAAKGKSLSTYEAGRLVRKGALIKTLVDGGAFTYSEVPKIQALQRQYMQLSAAGVKAGNTWKRAIIGFRITALSAISSVRMALSAIFSWTNVIIMAITGVITWVMNENAKAKEMEANAQQAADNAQDRFKTTKQFIEDNPIEAAIKAKDTGQIQSLIDSYREQLKQSPMDLNFMITGIESSTEDPVEKLKRYKQALSDLGTTSKQVAGSITTLVAAINRDSDINGFFDEGFFTNLGDYANSQVQWDSLIKEMSRKVDFKEWSEKMVAQYKNDGRPYIKELVRYLQSDAATLGGAMSKIGEIGNKYNNRGTALFDLAPFASSIYQSYADLKGDLNNFRDDFQGVMSYITDEIGVQGDKLTDEQYAKMLQYLEALKAAGQLTEDEMNLWLKQIREHFKEASPADFWRVSTTYADQLIAALKNVNAESKFAGMKSGQSFSEEQKKAITQAFNSLPAEAKQALGSVQDILNNNPLKAYILAQVSIGFNFAGNGDDVYSTFYRTYSKNGKHSKFAPEKGESYFEYFERIEEKYKKLKDEVRTLQKSTLKGAKEEFAKKSADIETLTGIAAWGKFTLVDPKEEQLAKKELSAARKEAKDQLKLLRDRFEIIKTYLETANKYREQYGALEGQKRLESSGIFDKTLSKGAIDKVSLRKSSKAFVDNLLKSIGNKTVEDREFRRSVLEFRAELDFDYDKEKLDKVLRQIKQKIEKQSEQWSLFNDMINAGLDRNMSMSVAFGGTIGTDNARDYWSSQLKDILTKNGIDVSDISNLLKMSAEDIEEIGANKGWKPEVTAQIKEMVKLWQDADKQISRDTFKMMAKAIVDAREIEEKITAIREEAARKRKQAQDVINDPKSNSAQKELARESIKAIDKQETKDVGAAQLELFKKNNDWERIFGDLERISTPTIQRLIKLTEQFVKTTAQAPEQVKALMEALTKMNKEVEGRNPWASLRAASQRVNESEELQRLMQQGGQWKSGGSISVGRDFNSLGIKKGDKVTKEQVEDFNYSGLKEQMDAVDKLTGMFQDLASAGEGLAETFDTIFAGEDGKKVAGGVTSVLGAAVSGGNAMRGVGGMLGLGEDAIKKMGIWGMAAGAALDITKQIVAIHDNKLEAAIQKSKEQVEGMQAAYEQVDKAIQRGISLESQRADALRTYSITLGYITKAQSTMSEGMKRGYLSLLAGNSAYMAQYQNLVGQREELTEQLKNEEAKKETDSSKVRDYQSQLADLSEQILFYAQEVAKEVLGIDLSQWADNISNAITEAFANGEDAVQAFNDTVDDMLRDVTNKMIQTRFIEPMVEELENALFGKDGSSGLVDLNDPTKNAVQIMNIMAEWADRFAQSIGASEQFFDMMNQATGGRLDNKEGGSSSMSGSVKNITEETADLLASYLNAVRGDVSAIRVLTEKAYGTDLPQMSAIAQAQLTQLNSVAENTRLNAEAAQSIRDLFSSVVTMSPSGRAIRIR